MAVSAVQQPPGTRPQEHSKPAKKPKLPREDDPRNPNHRLAALFDEGSSS